MTEEAIDGYLGLAAAMLRRAFVDLAKERKAGDARVFLTGEWAATIADGLGLDPSVLVTLASRPGRLRGAAGKRRV